MNRETEGQRIVTQGGLLVDPAGITVFNCEYALNFAPQAYAQSYVKNYVPYCTRRSLSNLSTTPPAFDCGVGCTAAAAPQTGPAPLTVNFSATATPAGCFRAKTLSESAASATGRWCKAGNWAPEPWRT